MQTSTIAATTQDTPLRERILTAAFSSFMEHGYAGTSTLDIARRAKVSKRDLYAHFASKQAMLAACIAARVERMHIPLHLPVPRDRAALIATLETFGTTLLGEVTRPEVLAVHRLALSEAERSPDVARTLDQLGRTATRAALAKMLAGAQGAGLLGVGNAGDMADDFTAALWRGGLMLRLLLRIAPPPNAREFVRRARAATQTLLRLYPPD
jgi:AcrR family transcriptional regulator